MLEYAVIIFWGIFCGVVLLLSVHRPIIGFCAAYFLMFFCVVRLDVPLLHTPLGAMSVLLLILSVIRPRGSGMGLSIPILIPWLALVLVLLLLLAIDHGDPGGAEFRVRTYIIGMWPLLLACFAIKSLRHARSVLITVLVVVSIVAALLLVKQVTVGQVALAEDDMGMRGVAFEEGGVMGYLNYGVLLAIAVCSPVLLFVALDGRGAFRWFPLVWVAWGMGVLAIMLSSYSSPMAALAFGNLLALLLRGRNVFNNFAGMALVGAAAIFTVVVIARMPGVQHTINRVRNPYEDASGSYRLLGISEETKAFFEAPWIGHGVKLQEAITPKGNLIIAHNSLTRDAASFGLLFLLPFWTMIVIIWRTYIRLLKRLRWPMDIAIVRGMYVGFLVNIAAGLITCTFGDFTQDTIFWTFTGILFFFDHWNRMRPEEPLFARVVNA